MTGMQGLRARKGQICKVISEIRQEKRKDVWNFCYLLQPCSVSRIRNVGGSVAVGCTEKYYTVLKSMCLLFFEKLIVPYMKFRFVHRSYSKGFFNLDESMLAACDGHIVYYSVTAAKSPFFGFLI